MIKSLRLVNFRNFSEKYIDNFELKNFIVWENWRWKTNILEALSILCDNSILKLWLDDLVKIWEEYFFIEIFDEQKGKIGFYYSRKYFQSCDFFSNFYEFVLFITKFEKRFFGWSFKK